jgi:DNA-binding MarR family transcriptional regulator
LTTPQNRRRPAKKSPVDLPADSSGADLAPGTGPLGFDKVEHSAWGGLLALQAGLIRRVEEDLDRHSRLTHPEFEVLLRLAGSSDHRARIQDLAAQSLLTRSGLSRVVERLERKGLVTRSPATEDGRGSYAELTAAGAELFATAADHHTAFVRSEFLSRFTRDELRTFSALLQRANDTTADRRPTQP